MACPDSVSVCFVAGDTITIDFQYTEKDGVTPIDLTGATAQMQLLNAITDENSVKVMTGGLTDPVNGIGQFSLTKVESQALLPIGTGGNTADIEFVSTILITFIDTTTKTIAGVDVEIKQGGIR